MFSPVCLHNVIWRRILCGLLCAVSWRGPVPVVHHHDQLTPDSEVHHCHLETFHSEDTECCEQWHWHFVLPDSLPSDEQRSPAAKVLPDLFVLGCSMAICDSLLQNNPGYELVSADSCMMFQQPADCGNIPGGSAGRTQLSSPAALRGAASMSTLTCVFQI